MGSASYDFACCNDLDMNKEDLYLAIVGSETTICLELYSEEARNWFLERLRLLCEDMLSSVELIEREQRFKQLHNSEIKLYSDYSAADISSNTQLKELLLRGIQINHHVNGYIVSSLISFDVTTLTLTVMPISEAEDDEQQNAAGGVGSYIWRSLTYSAHALTSPFVTRTVNAAGTYIGEGSTMVCLLCV